MSLAYLLSDQTAAVDLLPLLLDTWAAAYPGYRTLLSELFSNASTLTGKLLCNVIMGNVMFLDIFLPQTQGLQIFSGFLSTNCTSPSTSDPQPFPHLPVAVIFPSLLLEW